MTKNYKILTSYVKDISSKISGTENFIYLKDNIPKYSLGIDISSRIEQITVEEPPVRQKGIMVSNVSELVQKLKHEAKVIWVY